MKDRVRCSKCGVLVESDARSGTIFSFIILGVVFVTYQIDWRLSIISAFVVALVGLKVVRYNVVTEQENE